MNKSRLVWGIICLALAILLAVLNLTRPSDEMVFMLGDINAPYLPPIILGVVGIVLLATARQAGKEEPARSAPPQVVQDPEKVALNKRLETIAWGLFLIMLGGFMFVPDTVVKRGVWSIGVGIIMLGLNATRYMNKIRMSGFTTVLGILSVIGGVLQLFALQTIEGAILIIILGAYLILKPWFDERRLFGKAEES